ncbi:MAG TPA: hypothetical protein VGD61_15095 [Pyrinomonadaceae bacterium]
MSNQSKPYSFHPVGEPSELCLQARAQFLESVLRLKPQVVADLWGKAFPEFKLAVIRRFAKEILNGIEDIGRYFEEQQNKFLEDLQDQDSNYFHLLHRKLEETTGARPYGAFELLSERPDLKEKINEVIQHFLIGFQNASVVKLIQSKLTIEFGGDPITQEFRFYAAIAERDEDKALAAAIQIWSETWNLNADWCRDHAVAVLREWLSHHQLSSVGFYSTEQAMQGTGWASATHELLFASVASRVSTETAVYGMHGPKPLQFKWGSYNFERPGFNRLRESRRAYKEKSLAAFELYLSEKRRKPLLELVNSDEGGRDPKLEPYYEVLKQFKKVLNWHICETLKATDKAAGELIKINRKPALSNHVRWAVEFHVAPIKTLDEIVEFEESAIAIAEVLRDSNPKGLTRQEIVQEFSHYTNSDDVDRALALLLDQGIIYTQQEDPTSRVIDALRAEGRYDLFAPFRRPGDEQKAWAVISERINADYEKTGGIVIVRYFCAIDKQIRKAQDRSVVSRAVKDILRLIGLENSTRFIKIR